MAILVFVFVIVMLALVAALYTLIGVYVYRDAKRRGMNAALWTVVALLVPSFIGVVIYLLARNNQPEGGLCPKCAAPVQDGFLVCPKCGFELSSPCPSCGNPAASDWRICPHCKAELPPPRWPARPKSRTTPALIAVIIIVIVLTFGTLAAGLCFLPIIAYNSPSGVQIGSSENYSASSFSGDFSYFDGTKERQIRLGSGDTLTIKGDMGAESGTIGLDILDPAGNSIRHVDGSFADVIVVKAEQAGEYTIKMTMGKCKGHYNISWSVE